MRVRQAWRPRASRRISRTEEAGIDPSAGDEIESRKPSEGVIVFRSSSPGSCQGKDGVVPSADCIAQGEDVPLVEHEERGVSEEM